MIHSQFYFYNCNETAGIRVYSWTHKKFAPHLLKLVSASKILIEHLTVNKTGIIAQCQETEETDFKHVIFSPELFYFSLYRLPFIIISGPLIARFFETKLFSKSELSCISSNNIIVEDFRLYCDSCL